MREAFHLSPQQRRIWRRGGGRAATASIHFAPGSHPTPEELRRAVERLVERHEILRTTFVRPTGSPLPFQEIHPPAKGAVAWGTADAEEHFDPARLPGLAVSLEAGDGGGRTLTLTTSPLRLDRVSLSLLMEELLHPAGDGEEEPFQYADYAEWRHEEDGELESPAVEPAPRLPWEPPVSAREGAAGAGEEAASRVLERPLAPMTAEALALAVAAWGVSSGAVVLAAWATMLRRHAGRAYPLEVLAAGRDHEELTGAVGPYAEWRRLPEEGLAGTTGRELARALGPLLAAADDLEPAGTEPGGAGFEWNDLPGPVTVGKGSARLISAGGFTAGAPPLTLSLRTAPEAEPALRLFHAEERTSGVEAGRLLDRLEALIRGMAGEDRPLDDLSLLPPGEAEGLLAAAEPPPGDLRPVHLRFAAVAAERPEQTALVYEDRVMSYGELDHRVRVLAARLGGLGVGPEVPVPLAMERSAAAVVAMLAVLSAGGAFVPLDLAQPVDRLVHLTRQLGAPAVLTQGEARGTAALLECPVLDLDEMDWQAGPGLETVAVDGANLAYLIFTSGSSGEPKPVAVEHRNLAAYVAAVSHSLELDGCASFASLSTLAADLGYTAVFPALCSGAALQLVSHRRSADPAALAEQLGRHPVDCLKVVPGHLAALAAGDEGPELMPARRLILGGEALTPGHLDTLRRAAPPACRLFNHYGPTETTVGVAAGEVAEPDPRAATVPIGRALPGMAVHLLDLDLQPAADWLPGAIHVAGPQISRGYLGRPAATAERFVPDPHGATGGRMYRTGDLGRRLPGGEIEFLGRGDGQVKVRGFRVEMGEVEAALGDHPEVAEAAVTTDGAPAPRLLAYFTPRGDAAPGADALAAFLARRLPAYMMPASYTRLAALPRTANGKVDRRRLPAPAAAASADRPYAPPSTPAEEVLCRVWSEVLDVERVGAGDNFFELGGDSILSIQIIARVGEEGLRLEPMDVFEHQTVAELALVARRQAPAEAETAAPLAGPVPLTPIQHRFFGLELMEPGHWNQAVLLQVAGDVPAAALAATLDTGLDALNRHHDALRLRYSRDGDGWKQAYAAPEETAVSGVTVDLSALKEARATATAGDVAGRLQGALDLTRGPLFRAALLDLGAAGRRLFLVAHHLVVDGVSWRVLVDDLQRALGQLADGGRSGVRLPPRTASFRDHAEALVERAGSEAVTAEAAYWLSEERLAVPPLAGTDGAPSSATEGDAGRLRLWLPEEATRALLQEAPAAYRASVEELMLTAFADAVGRELGRDALLVDVERHGRDGGGLDLSRTVGWLTVVFPLLLAPGDGGVGERVARVKERVRSVPGRGEGYGLLRYLYPDAALRNRFAAAPAAGARFNYLGQAGAAVGEGSPFRLAEGELGDARAASTPLGHSLGADVLVVDGRLRCDWTWAPDRLDEAAAGAVARTFLTALEEMVAARGDAAGSDVPSDFPLASLSAEELETVGGLLEEIDRK